MIIRTKMKLKLHLFSSIGLPVLQRVCTSCGIYYLVDTHFHAFFVKPIYTQHQWLFLFWKINFTEIFQKFVAPRFFARERLSVKKSWNANLDFYLFVVVSTQLSAVKLDGSSKHRTQLQKNFFAVFSLTNFSKIIKNCFLILK